MWIMLTTGSVSIVERGGKHLAKDDTRTLQVRARRREWLDEFRERYCPELTESMHVEKADYQWRGFATPDEVALAVARAVLDIDYLNFKGATGSPQRGLKDPKLRSDLTSAYHKVWSTMLGAGDGTSGYDWDGWPKGIKACQKWGHYWKEGRKTCTDCKAKNPNYPKAGPEGVFPKGYPKQSKDTPLYDEGLVTGIEACRKWGHYWKAGAQVCVDCPEPNPSYPQAGPQGVFPDGYPEEPAKPKFKQVSAKGAIEEPADVLRDRFDAIDAYTAGSESDIPVQCAGSWQDFDPITVMSNAQGETARCDYCDQHIRVSDDGMVLVDHDEPKEVPA